MMKRSLLVLINLLSFASPSFAMLDKELEKVKGAVGILASHYREISSKDPLYQGRFLPSNANYPKVILVFPYKTNNLMVPFSASIPENQARAHTAFQGFLSYELSNYRQVYSFVVQNMSEAENNQYHALKPHGFVHPEAPYFFAGQDFLTNLQWTAIQGDEGEVAPLKGDYTHGLHQDPISTHAAPRENVNNNDVEIIMAMSGDVMHLTGINYKKSVDMHSLVAFEDTYHQNKKIVAITYHWLLNETDFGIFWEIMAEARTFRDLMNGLNKESTFLNLMSGLEKFVDLTERKSVLHPTSYPESVIFGEGGRITVRTDNNANASYQLESDRFPVIPGNKIHVIYDVTVEKDGIMSLGLLSTSKTWWYGEELILKAGHHQGIYDQTVPEGESHTNVVFRNHHLGTPGQTTFTINSFKIEEAADVKLQLNPTGVSQEVVKDDNGIIRKVRTDNNQYASYQLMSNRFAVEGGEKIRTFYDITVDEGGKISLGLLNTKGNGWYDAEVILGPGHHNDFFERIVPADETNTALVFRNYHLGTSGESAFTIESVKIEKEKSSKGSMH